jgi:sugar/nucleoside kinase (ribokinase family)
MNDILVIGEAMVDIHVTPTAPFAFGTDTPSVNLLEPGGSGTNIAVWLTHLGANCHLIASVGDDAFGAFLTDQCHQRGVHSMFMVQANAPTGTCVVLIDQSGERSMLPDAGANRAITISPAQVMSSMHHLHVSGYSLAHPAGPSILSLLSAFPGTSSIDLASTAIIPGSSNLQQAAMLADVVFGTEDEFDCLTQAPTASVMVIKYGKRGVKAGRGTTMHHVPAPEVQVVSTTGAGDAFAAGFLTAWLADPVDLPSALNRGTKCSHIALSRVAAWPPARVSGE